MKNYKRINFDDGYSFVYTQAYPVMKEFGLKGIVFVVVNWIGKPGFMSLIQLKELVESGWEIGSHTLNHFRLTKISLEEAEKEIRDSKKALEELGFEINGFAYPHGTYNQDIIEIVKKYYSWARICSGRRKRSKTQWIQSSYNIVSMFMFNDRIDFEQVYPVVHYLRTENELKRFKEFCRKIAQKEEVR